MADTAPRVVVLGSAGEAQQQLLNALNELGAQTLAVGDFDQLEPDEIRAKQPDVWLVSIDEGTDSGRLDRWQPLFDDPDSTVIFDDADVTRRLSGWDLARWARHLAAKVLGRDDVLPPVSPDAERLPQPAADDHPLPAFGDAGGDLVLPFAPSGHEMTDDSGHATVSGLSLADDADFAALSASFESERKQQETAEKPAMALDDLLMAHSASKSTDGGASAPVSGTAAAAPVEAPAKPTLSLLGDDVDLTAPRVAAKPVDPDTRFNLSHLELAPIEEPEAPKSVVAEPTSGIVAIIAGLGGPDSVRQFLGGLPAGLAAPVLLWQHLDAGKHDRLAQQMAKATKLPVYLAKPGDLARAGEVGIMGASMGVGFDEGWWINKGSPSPSHALAPALKDKRSVLVVLSGAEPVIAEFARTHKANGGLVLVQTSATCFDGTAAAALESQGIASGSPGNLATRAAERVAAG